MPKRIQRKRTAGWRTPECSCGCGKPARYVGRPTKWGNPVRIVAVRRSGPFDLERDGVGFVGQHSGLESARWSAVRRYRDLVRLDLTPVSLDEIRAELRGHDLMCWCQLDQPCHGDVLLELANPCPDCVCPDHDAPRTCPQHGPPDEHPMNVCAHPPETPAPHTKTVARQGRIEDGPGGAVNTGALGLTTTEEWL